MNKKDISIIHKSLRYMNELDLCMNEFGSSFDAFVKNSTFKNSACMCLLQVGELSNHFSDEFKDDNSLG